MEGEGQEFRPDLSVAKYHEAKFQVTFDVDLLIKFFLHIEVIVKRICYQNKVCHEFRLIKRNRYLLITFDHF